MPPGITRYPAASTTRTAFSIGSCAPMAETLSPLTPMSATHVSVAVTTVPFLITVSKRIFPGLRGHGARQDRLLQISRQNIARVHIQRFLFLAAHQINIELRHAGGAQGFQLFMMRLHGTDQAEAIDDFIGHE